MRILKVEPGEVPYVKDMKDGLEAIQQEVQGLFQPVYVEDGVILCCNEEGKLNGMKPNRWLEDDIICGPFFLVGDDHEGGFCSLTDEQLDRYTQRFREPEQFTGHDRSWSRALNFSAGEVDGMKNPFHKKEISPQEAFIRSFLDCIAPGVVKFEVDHYIFGNTYRCVWALREYPASTESQAILRHLGEKSGVTLRIYCRQVSPGEEDRIIDNANKKNKLDGSDPNKLRQAVEPKATAGCGGAGA